MSKAEEYSFNIPSELFQQLTKEQQVLWRKEIENTFNNGYHQAEEDFKLTWEDISIISECLSEVEEEIEVGQHKGCGLKGMYQEVLKRFKDYKK